jgi:exopolyphosphatase/guanosine-5'-triphosphate,3'-diphosphate pyrophosphatase
MAELRAMLTTCAPLATPDRRMALPGLPASRADVFPVALATLIAVADLGGVERFHHSFFNLRYGIAAEMLALGGTV